MSNIMSELETILGMCEYSKHKKMASELSKAEKELIVKIRNELTELAGPEDVDVVKIIKQELNNKYGVESIRNVDKNPLNDDNDWMNKCEDPEKYKK